MIFVTHSIPEAVLLADRIVIMAARPGRILMDLPVNLPRPRSLETERLAEFQDLVHVIREAIYGERKKP